jgi:hypothetical protein
MKKQFASRGERFLLSENCKQLTITLSHQDEEGHRRCLALLCDGGIFEQVTEC